MRKISERFVKVLVEFERNGEGDFDSKAKCEEIGYRSETRHCGLKMPSLANAADRIIGFNDDTMQGVSGRECTGRIIQEGPDKWIYEVDARLSQWEVA